MQALDAGITPCLSHIEQQVPRTFYSYAHAVYILRMRGSLVGLRLYLACFTPVAPVASSEATFDPPVALHVDVVFRWSRNCAKTARGEL